MKGLGQQTRDIYAAWKASRDQTVPPSYTEIGRQFCVNRNIVAGAVSRGRALEASQQRPQAER